MAHSERNGLIATKKRGSSKETISKQSKRKNNTLDIKGTGSISETNRDVVNSDSVRSLQHTETSEETSRGRTETSSISTSDVADTKGFGSDERELTHSEEENRQEGKVRGKTRGGNGDRNDSFDNKNMANTDSEGLERQWKSRNQFGSEFTATESGEERQGEMGQGWWSVEPNVGRVAHGIPKRVDRLKSLGNSLIPQIPYYLGTVILKVMNEKTN